MEEIGKRKSKILKAIVEEYIDTAEPVSSGEILKKYDMDISSATIRNEMVELEKLGLIAKPYSSAGRVPSEQGYRYYVDKLIGEEKLSLNDLKYIKKELENEAGKLEDISKSVIRTISELTHYTTIAIAPNVDQDRIEEVKFVYIKENLLMVIIVTNYGAVKEALISFDEDIDINILQRLEAVFKARLHNMKLSDIDGKIAEQILLGIKDGIEIAKQIIDEINRAINRSSNILLEGASKTFKLPEFRELDIAERFLSILDDKTILKEVLESDGDVSELSIYIGNENKHEDLKDFSVIRLHVKQGDKDYGTIGIVGPKRMNYKRVMKIMQVISEELGVTFEKDGKEDT